MAGTKVGAANSARAGLEIGRQWPASAKRDIGPAVGNDFFLPADAVEARGIFFDADRAAGQFAVRSVEQGAAVGDEFPYRDFQWLVLAKVVEGIVGNDEILVIGQCTGGHLNGMKDVHMIAQIDELLVPAEQIHAVLPARVYFEGLVEAHFGRE